LIANGHSSCWPASTTQCPRRPRDGQLADARRPRPAPSVWPPGRGRGTTVSLCPLQGTGDRVAFVESGPWRCAPQRGHTNGLSQLMYSTTTAWPFCGDALCWVRGLGGPLRNFPAGDGPYPLTARSPSNFASRCRIPAWLYPGPTTPPRRSPRWLRRRPSTPASVERGQRTAISFVSWRR